MEIINRGKQKQSLSSALGFTDGKLTTHLQIVHVVNSGKDTRERKRKIKREIFTFQLHHQLQLSMLCKLQAEKNHTHHL